MVEDLRSCPKDMRADTRQGRTTIGEQIGESLIVTIEDPNLGLKIEGLTG